MPSRTRTRNRKPVVGYRGFIGSTTSQVVLQPFDSCSDFVGNPHGDNVLSIEHFTANGGIIDHTNVISSSVQYRWDNVPAFNLASTVGLNTSSVPDADILNRLLASTGPLTPKVNLPLFVYELKDLPGMLKDAGDFLHGLKKKPFRHLNDKELASWTLAYQFGWGPLIQDISKMMNLTDLIQKKRLELKSASSSRGLKRRITLDTDMQTDVTVRVANSVGGMTFSVPTTTIKTAERWATCRWKIIDGQNIGYDPSFSEAFNAALGLNRGMIPIDVWKAIPWSWAIDWFADISNTMQKSYNMIYYRPSRICIMTRKTSTMSFPKWPEHGPTVMTGGSRIRETKARTVVSSPSQLPRLRLPFMDNFKLSVLGSFAILRIRGRQRST